MINIFVDVAPSATERQFCFKGSSLQASDCALGGAVEAAGERPPFDDHPLCPGVSRSLVAILTRFGREFARIFCITLPR